LSKYSVMIKNYFVLFFRNLKRQKLFSAINLLGLTVSIASTLMIYLYVQHEFSYDTFHANADRIYRINQTFIWGENNNAQFASTGPGVAYAVKEELAEVELITSIHTPGDFIISYTQPNQKIISFEENDVLAADTNFFRMFNFPLLKGDVATVLEKPNTMVMTISTAKKYFGDADPIGKLVRLGGLNGQDQKTYEVTGVVADLPTNSYIEFDILLSLRGYPIERLYWSWVWTQLETYVRLIPNANVEQVKTKLAAIPQKRVGETLRAAFNTTYEDYIKSGKKWELFLQPMTSIHLPEEMVLNRLNDSGNIQVIYSFIGAAVFIVILSCINFMNLSTAQFTRRLKEASVRKIMGLGRKELTLGYFLEAFVFCLIALVISIGVAQLALPGFNFITEKSLRLDFFESPVILLSLFGLILTMALVSSSYPSLFLSSFHPVEAMKGRLKAGKQGKSFRNGLVIFQFSISVILIICTAIVFQQLNFVSQKDLGFNKENLMVLRHVETSNGESIVNEILKSPGVRNAAWCNSVPPSIYGGDTFGAEENMDLRFPMNFTRGDENYIPALNLKLKIGRNFSVENPGDHNRIIVNEATIQKLGWKMDESVIGKKIIYPGSENATFEIVGVVSDFNYWSISNPIEPFGLFHIKNTTMYPEQKEYIVIRMDESQAFEKSIAGIEAVWKKHSPNSPFDFSFVDQAFAETFKTQQQFGSVLTVMATLAIVIASLGLLGMIIYALEQRTKEIGIRKVSGASVWNILTLISKGYSKLIFISVIIGAPVSWFMMNKWLDDFAYRVTPSPWIFVCTGLGIFVIAIMITSYHSVKAALTNPVDVLKDE
jgi:putative ABC transport system permease protein